MEWFWEEESSPWTFPRDNKWYSSGWGDVIKVLEVYDWG